MKRMILCSVAALALALAASAATACPKHAKAEAKGEDASLASSKVALPSDGAKTVATDGRSESTKAPCGSEKAASAKLPCHDKAAKTVSAKTSPCSKKSKTVADKGGCPIEAKSKAVLASMPAIEYRVGDEVIGCSKSAAAMAKESGKPLEYVIGKESFKKEGEAEVRLASLLEEAATDMLSVQYVADGKCGRCPMTAKSIAKSTGTKVAYRVGGVDFEKKEDADKVAKLVADAAKSAAMTYKVDGKTYHCDKTAGEKCKKSGKKMTYVVGDSETGCATSAKLMQAQAKVRKIIETASAASFSL